MRKRILLVAHEADAVEAIPITLELAGHKVILAECGMDGIRRAQTAPPDLVLVDATLPDMDGTTIIDILRRLPSTAALGTILLKPRGQVPFFGDRAEHRDAGSLNSSELLLEVAEALALCHDARHEIETLHIE